MKIENLEYLTFQEAVNKIASRLADHHVFADCDMALNSPQDIEPNESMERIYHNSCSWCGIKKIDSPFDFSDSVYMVDMYGGGAAQIINVYRGEDMDSIIADVRKAFEDCASSCGYGMNADEHVLIERIDRREHAA